MPMRSRQQKGSITVYLTLTFALFLSLLLALVEGAAMGAARLQAELVADLGLDSIFAEYHRELFSQYGLLFIDDSYGTGRGSIAKVENHLADYMSYNLNPNQGLLLAPGNNWVHLKNVHLEIEEAAFATDEHGAVWRAQAIDWIKSRYGMDIIKGVQEQLQTIEKEQLLSGDLKQTLEEYKREFEDVLVTEQITETGGQTEEGFSYDLFMDFLDSFTGKGILYLAVEEPGTLSGAVMERTEAISYRASQGNVNQGCGLPDYIEAPDGIVNKLLFDEFLLEKYGSYIQEKENSHLKYQIEYILYGRDNDISNLRECAERIFLLRSVSNYLYLLTRDSAKAKEVEFVATAICTLLCVPDAGKVLTQIILILWAMAEGVYDVRCLFEGGKIPLIKKQGEWKIELGHMFSSDFGKGDTNKSGISYEGYLRIFLAVMLDENTKTMRSMDIAEMDIQKTAGNEDFRIDQCMDYVTVTFGFQGDRGQEYVFTRSMRYE